MSGRKHTTGGTVLAHLQTTATCPERTYHWRNSSCPSANQNYMSGRKHTTGGTVLAHLQTTATCPRGSIPLAKQFLPTCKPQLHVQEEAYHWRNGPCPPANHSYISGRKHTTGGTVLAHLQPTATSPGGSIPLAKQFLPICKPKLHVREEAYHWRNGPCPPANHSYMSRRKHTTGGTVLAHLQPHLQIQDEDTSLLPATLQSRSVVSRANFWSVSSPCWETNTVP
jgi:hypothetical protein